MLSHLVKSKNCKPILIISNTLSLEAFIRYRLAVYKMFENNNSVFGLQFKEKILASSSLQLFEAPRRWTFNMFTTSAFYLYSYKWLLIIRMSHKNNDAMMEWYATKFYRLNFYIMSISIYPSSFVPNNPNPNAWIQSCAKILPLQWYPANFCNFIENEAVISLKMKSCFIQPTQRHCLSRFPS